MQACCAAYDFRIYEIAVELLHNKENDNGAGAETDPFCQRAGSKSRYHTEHRTKIWDYIGNPGKAANEYRKRQTVKREREGRKQGHNERVYDSAAYEHREHAVNVVQNLSEYSVLLLWKKQMKQLAPEVLEKRFIL